MDNSNYNNNYESEFLDFTCAKSKNLVNPRCMPAKIKRGEESYWNQIGVIEKANRALGIESDIKVIYRRGHVEDMPEIIGMTDQRKQNREFGTTNLHRALFMLLCKEVTIVN